MQETVKLLKTGTYRKTFNENEITVKDITVKNEIVPLSFVRY